MYSSFETKLYPKRVMFDPYDPANWVGPNGSPNPQYIPFSPSSQYLSAILAPADASSGVNQAGSVAPEFIDFIDFMALRRSQTRSVGSGHSPRLPGNQTPFTNLPPQPAISNRHPLSPIVVNNCQPPPPPPTDQSSKPNRVPQKAQPSPSRPIRFSSLQWDCHREKIKKLFMDDDKSLDETMKFMEENCSFAPSYVEV